MYVIPPYKSRWITRRSPKENPTRFTTQKPPTIGVTTKKTSLDATVLCVIHKLFVATPADKERHKTTVSTAKNDAVTDTVCSLKLRHNSLTFRDSRWRS
jgi:hypothetical protein